MASHLDLRFLTMSHLWDARLKWVKVHRIRDTNKTLKTRNKFSSRKCFKIYFQGHEDLRDNMCFWCASACAFLPRAAALLAKTSMHFCVSILSGDETK